MIDKRLADALGLDARERQINQLGHMRQLNARKRLQNAGEILLQEIFVQIGDVRANNRVIFQL
jgi:hypothetical protein